MGRTRFGQEKKPHQKKETHMKAPDSTRALKPSSAGGIEFSQSALIVANRDEERSFMFYFLSAKLFAY